MAKRLIDAEALWRRLEAEPWYNNADRDEVALPLIDEAPTVDAVEVVRCSRCRHGDKMEDGGIYCHIVRDCRTPDDFCSYGERRCE